MKEWQKTERKISRKCSGKQHARSGAYIKGDVSNKLYCIEIKSTSKDYIVLKSMWFKKIEEAAQQQRKIPVIVIDFLKYKKIFYIVPSEYNENTISINKSMNLYYSLLSKYFYNRSILYVNSKYYKIEEVINGNT